MYTEPSTPTVMRITSWLRLSRMRLMTPASPAEHMCAARVETLSQARRTISQSVAEGRSPSVLRMLWICLRSPGSLRGGAGRGHSGPVVAPGPTPAGSPQPGVSGDNAAAFGECTPDEPAGPPGPGTRPLLGPRPKSFLAGAGPSWSPPHAPNNRPRPRPAWDLVPCGPPTSTPAPPRPLHTSPPATRSASRRRRACEAALRPPRGTAGSRPPA